MFGALFVRHRAVRVNDQNDAAFVGQSDHIRFQLRPIPCTIFSRLSNRYPSHESRLARMNFDAFDFPAPSS